MDKYCSNCDTYFKENVYREIKECPICGNVFIKEKIIQAANILESIVEDIKDDDKSIEMEGIITILKDTIWK